MFVDDPGPSKSPVPMLSGVAKEWLPSRGVSWHVPHVPMSFGMPPDTSPPADASSLIPATPVMLIGMELKSDSPRAIAERWSESGSLFQAVKRSKMLDE